MLSAGARVPWRAPGRLRSPRRPPGAAGVRACRVPVLRRGQADGGEEKDEDRGEPRTLVEDVEAAPREAVLRVCLSSTAVMAAVGLGARAAAHGMMGAGAIPVGMDLAASLPFLPASEATPGAVAAGLAAGLAVTAVRFALLQSGVWPDFRDETDASNARVLPALNPLDLAVVALLPAWSEEVLFRGVLLPALGGGPVGVVASGAAFGVLHRGGGRGWAFAGWATGVGCLYGATAVAYHALLPAALAHGVGNLSSAALWRALRGGNPQA